jgi:hypothetical protein
MRRSVAGWCAAALCLVALTGCASATSSGSPSGSPSASPGSPSAAPIRGGPPITVAPPRPIEPSDGTMTLSGEIFAGAEPSCLLMNQGTVQYLLIAGDTMDLRAGQRAVVTGHVVQGIKTHCMQGVPFQVTNVDPLGPN